MPGRALDCPAARQLAAAIGEEETNQEKKNGSGSAGEAIAECNTQDVGVVMEPEQSLKRAFTEPSQSLHGPPGSREPPSGVESGGVESSESPKFEDATVFGSIFERAASLGSCGFQRASSSKALVFNYAKARDLKVAFICICICIYIYTYTYIRGLERGFLSRTSVVSPLFFIPKACHGVCKS